MKNIKEILDKFILQSGFDERQYGPGGQIVKEYPKKKIKKISEIEKIAKKSVIYNRR